MLNLIIFPYQKKPAFDRLTEKGLKPCQAMSSRMTSQWLALFKHRWPRVQWVQWVQWGWISLQDKVILRWNGSSRVTQWWCNQPWGCVTDRSSSDFPDFPLAEKRQTMDGCIFVADTCWHTLRDVWFWSFDSWRWVGQCPILHYGCQGHQCQSPQSSLKLNLEMRWDGFLFLFDYIMQTHYMSATHCITASTWNYLNQFSIDLRLGRVQELWIHSIWTIQVVVPLIIPVIPFHSTSFGRVPACLLQAKNNVATMHAQRGEACKINLSDVRTVRLTDLTGSCLTKVLPCCCHAETGWIVFPSRTQSQLWPLWFH